MEPIQIRMFGEFSLETGGIQLLDANKRARKMWCLLAYLICNRKRYTSQRKLIDLLYGEDSESVNPENALRITMHRLRGVLDQLWPGAGKELLLHKDGAYCWNPEAKILLDCENFEELAAPAREGEDPISRWLQALELYRGEFLPRHSDENWVIPVATHYHNRFVELTMEAANLLIEKKRPLEASALCRRASETEPYHEPLYQVLLRALGAAGETKAAANVYETLKKRLFDDFGIAPTRQTQEVYRSAAHSPEDRTLPIDEVLEHLKEPESKGGALMCDYDYFKILCFTESRAMERSGHAAHVALLSVGGNPSRRIMDQLGEHIRLNLRRGDTASQCSATQYILLLPRANYENSCMVCRRVVASFHHAHPRAAVQLHFIVQPLAPGISVL